MISGYKLYAGIDGYVAFGRTPKKAVKNLLKTLDSLAIKNPGLINITISHRPDLETENQFEALAVVDNGLL